MRRKLRSPLPPRNGLSPARLQLPVDGEWDTLRGYLAHRLSMVAPGRIDEMLATGAFVGVDGPFRPDAPYLPGSFVWFHRDLPDETPVPFQLTVLHRDEHLVVVHKPHFLATIPRGKHVRETALVRLRNLLELPRLSPAHRLDRVTAGVLLFVVRPEDRGAYQTMFRDRLVTKEYEAIASYDPTIELPTVVRSRIVKERGVHTASEVPGPPNAETEIELLEHRDGLGRYRLRPATGRTHQLRVHMNRIGLPILGDTFYPVHTETPLHDFRRPLQLLARAIEFTDPITGQQRRFHSTGALTAWTCYQSWNSA